MNTKTPLRLILTSEKPADHAAKAGSESTPTSPTEAPKDRVVGRRLLAFLNQYADSIDTDIRNILDL